MEIIITNTDGKVIAIIPHEDSKDVIIRNGYKAFRTNEPSFSNIDGDLYFTPIEGGK